MMAWLPMSAKPWGKKVDFYFSPNVTELCLLVASVRAGPWAQRAVKLKAAAQSGLLPRVCIQPKLLPAPGEGVSQGSFVGTRTKEPGGGQDPRAVAWPCKALGRWQGDLLVAC